jgi:Ca-activated chloride channel family protein
MIRKLIALIGTVALSHSIASVSLYVNPGNPVLIEKQTQTTLLQIRLEGADRTPERADRLPVNLSVVIDRSGSMSGDRMEQAKEAARTVVNMLGSQDIFSLVTYSDEAETLIPATKLTDRAAALRAIDAIYSDGNTALFAGVSKGLAEVRKFKMRNRVNRVILLSDGQANVGPSNPSELGDLGRSAGRSGIGVTTIGLGLGYNEDLMSQLAMASDGNHAFAENSSDLARIFQQEIGGVLSVVAQSIEIIIQCPSGVRPIRILDQDAEIRGQSVHLNYNQIYGRQNKTLLLEVEVSGKREGQSMELASVQVGYDDPASGRRENISGNAQVRFTASQAVVKREVYKPAVVEAAKARGNMASKKALELRDKGDFAGAGAVMQQNAKDMEAQATSLDIPELAKESDNAKAEAAILSAPAPAEELNKSRKELKAKQYERSSQFSIQKK